MGEKIFVGVQQNFGAVGCPFGARTPVVAGVNTSVKIPGGGWWLVETDANTTVRFTYNSGTNFVTVIPASSAGYVWSDGFNVEIRGNATGGTAQRSAVLGAG